MLPGLNSSVLTLIVCLFSGKTINSVLFCSVETLSQKMERMNDAMDCSSESDSELIPPSFSNRSHANWKFLAKDVTIINELFAEVIKKGSCKDEEISALTNNADGKKLSKKFAVCTIKNRIKYEIRKKKTIKK